MQAPQKLLHDANSGRVNMNDYGQGLTLDAASGGKSDKKKGGGTIDLDWSRPMMSVNLANVRQIEVKKDTKMEIL